MSCARSQMGASQVALVVKNLPVKEGDIRDTCSIPGSGRSPGGGNGNPLQWDSGESHRQRSVEGCVHGWQRVGHG